MKKQMSTRLLNLQLNMQSNAKIDDLYRKLQDNQNSWFALDFILDHLTEAQKVRVRTYIKGLLKEEKNVNLVI